MKKFLESLGVFAFIFGVFALILGIWLVFASGIATLASRLPTEDLVVYVGGGATMLGLFFALGLAARIVGRRLARPSNPEPGGR